MKKKVLFFILIFTSIFSIYSQSKSGYAVTVRNNTGYTVYYMYISKTAADDWGDDFLKEGLLLDENSITVRLLSSLNHTDRYDIRLIDEDGDTYTKWNVLINPDTEIVFTMDDIGE